MITIKATFGNNDYLVTNINCTFEEAKSYYLNNIFNTGSTMDNIQKCVKVEQL